MRIAHGDLTLKDAFKFYKSKYKGKDKFKIDKKLYISVMYDINKEMVRRMFDGEKITLPYRLSAIRVCKYKMKFDKLYIDFGEWKKSGKKVYHLNEHSDDYMGYFFWHKRKCIVTNSRYYRFHATRTLKRQLAKILKEPNGHCKYAERDYRLKT